VVADYLKRKLIFQSRRFDANPHSGGALAFTEAFNFIYKGEIRSQCRGDGEFDAQHSNPRWRLV
jgi:hypothetical protein